MKKDRIVNYHGRGRKKTAKIAAQIRAVGAHLADLYIDGQSALKRRKCSL